VRLPTDDLYVYRLPEWGSAQRALLALVCGAYFIGLLFYHTSGLPHYKAAMKSISELASAYKTRAAKKETIGKKELAGYFRSIQEDIPAPPPDAFVSLFGWSPSEAAARGLVWQVFTYALLHDARPMAFWHFLNTVLVLTVLGGLLEHRYGIRRLLILLAGGAVFGALFPALVWPGGQFIGPTGPMLAMIVVALFTFSSESAQIGRFCFQLRGLALMFGLTTALTGLLFARAPQARPTSALQYMAHAGTFAGAGWGYAFYRLEPVLFSKWQRWRNSRRQRMKRMEIDIRTELDKVLEKLHTQGVESLSRRERSFLREASRFLKKIQHKD